MGALDFRIFVRADRSLINSNKNNRPIKREHILPVIIGALGIVIRAIDKRLAEIRIEFIIELLYTNCLYDHER